MRFPYEFFILFFVCELHHNIIIIIIIHSHTLCIWITFYCIGALCEGCLDRANSKKEICEDNLEEISKTPSNQNKWQTVSVDVTYYMLSIERHFSLTALAPLCKICVGYNFIFHFVYVVNSSLQFYKYTAVEHTIRSDIINYSSLMFSPYHGRSSVLQ